MATINPTASRSGGNRLAAFIVLAMLLGVLAGWLINQHYVTIDPKYIKVFSDLFLNAIKMIIAPLVLSTLTVGIAQMGSGSAIGRVGLKAIAWFVVASFISLLLGMFFANVLQPGVGNIAPALGTVSKDLTDLQGKAQGTDFITFLTKNVVPTSIFKAGADNMLLQIVVFSMLFGVALSSLGSKGKLLVDMLDQVSHVMIKMTTYVMKAAPIAVFAAMSSVIAERGLPFLNTMAKFMGFFYIALIVLWVLLVFVGYLFLGGRVFALVREIKEAFFLSFATASSEAAYPKILDALDRFGVSRKISTFVLSLGYSFNLDGSMMYCTFASIFIAQLYEIPMTLQVQFGMLMFLMLTSKGMAGIPSASLVVILGALQQFGLPQEGMILIFAIDRFLDMGRSATNAVGNSIAAAVIGKWEGELLSVDAAAKRALSIKHEAEATVEHHL